MIFRSGVFSRKPGLSDAQFAQHWQEVHGALARQMPGLHSYYQHHIVERLYECAPFPEHPIDGVSQLWFDDIAAMEHAERSPEYAACKKDIPEFQGAITVLVLAQAARHQRPASGGARLLLIHRQHDALGLPDAAAPVLQQALDQAASGLQWAAQHVVVDRSHPVAAQVPQGQQPISAMTELGFADEAALRQWVASEAGDAFIHRHPCGAALALYRIERIQIK